MPAPYPYLLPPYHPQPSQPVPFRLFCLSLPKGPEAPAEPQVCLLCLSSRPGEGRRAGRWDQAGSMDATLLLLSADCTAAASGRLRPRLPAGPHVASPGPSAWARISIRTSAAPAPPAVRGLPHHASVAGVRTSPSLFTGSSF